MGCSNGKSKQLEKLKTAPSVSFPEKVNKPLLQTTVITTPYEEQPPQQEQMEKVQLQTQGINQHLTISRSSLSKFYSLLRNSSSNNFDILFQHSSYATQPYREDQEDQNSKEAGEELRCYYRLADSQFNGMLYSQIPQNHPNILNIYEIFQDDDNYYLSYENTVGGTLVEWMDQKQNKLSEAQISTIMNQIISALHYLHNMGMYHGNLTIDSFELLDQSGVIKIKLVDIQTAISKPETTLLSVPYTSPECCINNDYTAARDIWAIGIIMYYLLSGYLPYSISKKHTIENIKSQIRRQQPTFDGVAFEMRSDQAKILLGKLLKRNPLDRITTMGIQKEIWLKQGIKQDINQSPQWCQLSQQTKKIGLFQSSILYYMINQFCSEEQQKLVELFNQIDINKDNKLSRIELMNLYTATYNEEESIAQVNRIFKYADVDNSGEIDFYEFIVSITDKQGLITKENIDILFKLLADKNGSISIHHLSTKFGIPKQAIFIELQQQLSSQTSHKQVSYKHQLDNL